MPSAAKRILIAGEQPDLRALAALLTHEGFAVGHCADGARGLELALAERPEMVIVDTSVALLPAAKLAQILRANPRTAEASFVFIGREGEEVEGFQRRRDRFVPRPFNPEQVLADLKGHFARRERAAQVGRQEKQIEGNLQQISLIDLLQVFALNRKDGELVIIRDGERGSVYLLEGCVVNARIGVVTGEKAIYRLLRWEEGKFSFAPGRLETEVRIAVPTDHLIMEGLRQNDEMAAQAGQLPAAEDRLALKVSRDRLPQGLRPATQEILVLLEYYQRVQDLLDHSPRTDFEVLQVLRILIDKGLVEKRAELPLSEEGRFPLLTADEVIAMRDHLGERDSLLEDASAKLILLAASAAQVQLFVQSLQGIEEFLPESGLLAGSATLALGDVGRLAVGETFSLRLFCLPATAESAPLWTPFCRRLFGVVSLADAGELPEAEEFFRQRVRLPVARVAFAGAPADAFLLQRGDRPALRRLLAFFASRFPAGKPGREEP
jgi:CheY-like chemotaxis protein